MSMMLWLTLQAEIRDKGVPCPILLSLTAAVDRQIPHIHNPPRCNPWHVRLNLNVTSESGFGINGLLVSINSHLNIVAICTSITCG